MLGWHISVYRKPGHRSEPAQFDTAADARLAVWQGGLAALGWIDDLIRDSNAQSLGGDGYPLRYTARAEHVVPVILEGPPDANETWHRDATDIVTEQWAGRTVIDHDAIAACEPSEWLLIEAWDES